MKRDDKVLVVEDHPRISRSLEAVGEELCFTCDYATDGWDAIEKLETGEYAAIIIDTDMPRHSGFGVLNYLREEVGEELDHVIVMTSSSREEVHRKFSGRLTVVNDDNAVKELTRVLCADSPVNHS